MKQRSICLLIALAGCSDSATSGVDASAMTDANVVTDTVEPLGTCKITVDGISYASAPMDPATIATRSDDFVSVQCVATAGDTRHGVNLGFKVTAVGAAPPSVAAYSIDTGNGSMQFNALNAAANVLETSATNIAATVTFVGRGTADKNVRVNLNLPLQ